MGVELIPFRWPDGWSEEELIIASPFNCLWVEGTQSGAPLRDGLRVVTDAPAGVRLLEGIHPHIKISRRDDGTVEAGPTGKPWVESNGWSIELHRALYPAATLWVTFSPPENRIAPASFYLRSVAETAAYGARWVVTLDPELVRALASKDPGARRTWDGLTALSRFFSQKREWASWQSVAAIGVISTFSGDAEFLSHEFLKLAARRPLPIRILPATAAATLSWDGLKAIVVAGEAPLPAAVEEKLRKFSGAVFRQAKEQWEDPWLMAEQVHLRVGRQHDVIRLYNGSSANVRYARSADGRRAVVQVFAFGPPLRDVTVAVNQPWRTARLFADTHLDPSPLRVVPSRFGSELALPRFEAWAAIELEA